jgi:hypothetical protein
MLRSDESNILEKVLDLPITKKATYFERVNFACAKKDPFEGRVDADVWKVIGNKLLKKKTASKEEWIEVDKYKAAKDWNEGKKVKLVWNKKPDGVVLDKFDVGKFFSVDPDSFSFKDVLKNGYPHIDLKIFIKQKQGV